MIMKIDKFLERNNKIAIVGVNINPEKWGYKIYKNLKQIFSKVYAVNPKYEKIENNKCYPDLTSLPEKPDIVITITPPKITESIVKTCKKIGIKKIWMQPGSESKKAIDFCKTNNIDVIYNLCFIMNGLKNKAA